MAKISRRMAINNAYNVLNAYCKKIEAGIHYSEYLPQAGRQIVKRYNDNEDNYKSLLDAAVNSKEFFTGMDDETLLSYANVCHELNKIFDLKVSESRKIKGFIEEKFVVRSEEEIITGIKNVEIGRKVEYRLGTAEKLKEDRSLFNRYYIEWEVQDIDNNFSDAHNTAEAVAENIADYLDNSFSNPYDRTFYASKEGRYIIKAKVHDLVIGNIIDTIEFEQIVETGDETIIAMDLQQKILRALQLTDWKVELDFAALSEALFTATGVIIAIAAIEAIALEVAGAIVAIMTIGLGIDATINIIKGIVQLAEALELIEKARSGRALQVGGEKLKEGILNIGVGIIEALLAKFSMKNFANARAQALKNVTPKTPTPVQPALPMAAGSTALPVKSGPQLPAVSIGREELTVILNKSAANAVENAAHMSIPQSEKTALREMTDAEISDSNCKEVKISKTSHKVIKNGLDTSLLDELARNGVKHNPEEIIQITKTVDGKLVWLEKGNNNAGLEHIMRHADEFVMKGISTDKISDFIIYAIKNGKIVGIQRARPIYEVIYEGKLQRIAITISDNGFIVGANPKSIP